MSEQPEELATAAPGKAEEQPRRRRWPLVAWIVVALVTGIAGAVAGLGTEGALILGGCVAATAVAGIVVWRLPQLRRHFARPGGRSRSRPGSSRSRRFSLGGGSRKGKMPGLGGRKGKLPGLGGRKGAGGTGRKGVLAGLGGRKGKMPGPGDRGRRSALGRVGARIRAAGRKIPGAGLIGRRRGRGAGKPASGKRAGPGRIRRAAAAVTRGPRAAGRRAGRRARGVARVLRLGRVARFLRLDRLARKLRRAKPSLAPAAAAPPAAPAAAPAKTPLRRPGQPLRPRAWTGRAEHEPPPRRRPVSHSLQDTAEAIEQGIGAFEPENANDLGDFLRSLPDVHEAQASAYNRQADQLADGQPVHPAVIEHLRELASQSDGLREYAAETHHIWATAHEAELQRLEEPRVNERLWDVAENS